MSARKRILFLQVNINPPGGGQSVAAWALQALKDEYAITFVTWKPPQWEAVNRFYGTQLHPSQFHALHMPAWLRRLVALDPDEHSYQPFAFLMRVGRWMTRNHDLVVTFNDESDPGVYGIQYIHFPWLSNHYREEQHFIKASFSRRVWYLLNRRLRPWRLISGFDFDRMRHNLTLVNSDWTGKFFRQNYGTATTTLHPPIAMRPSSVPWAERENGFISIGRISPEKKYENTIAILEQVRAQGHNVHLHIVGAANEDGLNTDYYYEIRTLVDKHATWVSFEENISREELIHLITTHRYGIHGMVDEHFGLAVGELMCGGAIVFVPNDGGQVEIVGDEPQLLYKSPAEAVEKITRVLNDAHAQTTLRAQLAARAELFSTERFMGELREIVAATLRGDARRPNEG